MKNSEHFGELTSRMNHFREEVLDKKPYICAKRALLATEAYKEHLNEPPIMKRAYMLKNILEKMPIYIEEDTLIVGNQASSNRDAPIFPEYTMEFVMNELDLFEKRDGDVFYITEETKYELRSIAPFWENNNLRSKGGALLPDEVSVYMETGFFGMEGKLNSGDAHLAVDYQQVLQKGLKGYEERVALLEHLKVDRRKEVAQKLKEAREQGDLSENAEYDAAKDEQRDIETQIAELEEILKNAEVIQEDNTDSDAVKMESTVVLHDVEFDEDIEYVIVGSSEADSLNNKISNESPLGAAMLGKKVGDIVKVEAPIGVVEYKIVSVKND